MIEPRLDYKPRIYNIIERDFGYYTIRPATHKLNPVPFVIEH